MSQEARGPAEAVPNGRKHARGRLVGYLRELNEAVGLADTDDEVFDRLSEAISGWLPVLRRRRLDDVPRMDFVDAVGVRDYSWHPYNPTHPDVRVIFDGQTALARFDRGLGQLWAGPPGFLHGGMSALLLDVVCSSLLQYRGIAAVTATLDVQYRRPIRLHTPIRIRARIGSVTGRKSVVVGEIETDEGIAVHAESLLVTPRTA
jgi:acyl-coenzyme A thioesterase PaaI-like protein